MQRVYAFSVFVFISNALVKTSSIEVEIGEPYCCGYTTSNEVCHDTCTQLHIPQDGSFFQKLQILFPSKCPKKDPKLAEFWRCVNRNNETEGGWVGRRCCESTVANECRSACLSANSSADIVGSCIPDDESTLYECIMYRESKQKCCGKRFTNATHLCRRHCDDAFEDGPTRKDIQHIRNICDDKMATCMEGYAKKIITTSTKKLHCCEQAEDETCRLGCKNILQTELSNKKIVQRMSQVCGDVIPHEPMWRCFFAGQPRETDVREVNTVSCCYRALSPTCRELCFNIYRDPTSDSHVWKLFDIQCRVPGSEIELNQCLNEVDEPCEMGCKDEMSFCTNFNDRPTELFRSCSASGDENARDEYNKWSGGVIALPTHWIPIKNIQQCEPEKWKAVVCALHIKPCGYRSGHSFICKSDCMALMEKCADTERFGPGMTIAGMCEMFSPDHMQENCISLSTYTKPSQTNTKTIVTQPCNPNPCSDGHVCIINRELCVNCSKHKCVPGCKMGYGSKVNALQGSLVRLPDSSKGEGCFKACTCLKSGLYKCKPLPCINAQKSCKIAGQIKSHGSSFYVDCNFCNCFSGNVTCTKRQCLSADSTTAERQHFTEMPCNCPGTYNPVCGDDGQTYLNSCVAICISSPGSNFSTGTCFGKDPCQPNPCGHRHFKCVPTPRVCITLPSKCRQYECIIKNKVCKKVLEGKSLQPKRRHRGQKPQIVPEIFSSSYFFSPTVLALNDNAVCDTKHTRHEDVCKLARKSKLDYKGTCQDTCRSDDSFVCGYDRVTYNNPCIANSNLVLIDHEGPCRRVQTSQDNLQSDPCYGVTCPQLTRKGCPTILPPGSCCPVCGAMINALLNPDHLQSISHTTWKGPVTIRDIMLIMRRQLHVLECDIYGHLTIDGDLAMMVISTLDHPTLHEIEACNREAERLFQLISNRSPTLTLYALLWPITAATITCGGQSGTSAIHASSFLTHMTLTFAICLVHAFTRRLFSIT